MSRRIYTRLYSAAQSSHPMHPSVTRQQPPNSDLTAVCLPVNDYSDGMALCDRKNSSSGHMNSIETVGSKTGTVDRTKPWPGTGTSKQPRQGA